MCHHSSVSLNKEIICDEISEDKIAVCKKTQGLRSGKFSDLNSACSKVLVPVKIFQFHDMHYESERYRDAANGLYLIIGFKQPIKFKKNVIWQMSKNKKFTYDKIIWIAIIDRKFHK